MAYYTKVLQPDETVKVVGRLHWSIYIRGLRGAGGRGRAAGVVPLAARSRLAALCAVGGRRWSALLGLLLLLGAWIRRRATEIVVTDRRVIFKRGLLSRHTVEMNVSKIETVDVEQGLRRPHLGLRHGDDPRHRVRLRAAGRAWVRRWRSATRSWWGKARGRWWLTVVAATRSAPGAPARPTWCPRMTCPDLCADCG